MSSQSLRVLQVLPNLDVGGVERGTVDWAVALQQLGHQAAVISGGGRLVETLQQHGVQHFELSVGKKSLTSFLLIKRLRQIFDQWQPQIVHARSRLPAWLSYWAIHKMNRPRPRFVTTLHGLHTVSPYASVMARGERVIAVSQTAKAYLEQHFSKYLQAPPTVVYRGVDELDFPHGHQAEVAWQVDLLRRFPNLQDKKKVLLPGRLRAIKGAMEVLPWLQNAAQDVVLLLNGKQQESGFAIKLQRQAVQLGVADKLIWLGYEADMKQLFAYVDLVISVNSRPESFGRTVLEALTIGTPVVAFDKGGVAEVMQALWPQGLVEDGNWSALAKKIDDFLHNKVTVPAHQQFSNHEAHTQTMQVYQQLLELEH